MEGPSRQEAANSQQGVALKKGRTRVAALTSAGLMAVGLTLGLSTSASGHDRPCPTGWSEAFVIPGTLKDKNENGRICFKMVNGEGNAAGEGFPGFNTKDDHVHN
jgi:hypothetical protein